MNRRTRMQTWAGAMTIAAFCAVVTWRLFASLEGKEPGLGTAIMTVLAFFFMVVSLTTTVIAIISLYEYLSESRAINVKEMELAKTAGTQGLMLAAQGVNSKWIEVIGKGDRLEYLGLVGSEEGPLWSMQLLTRKVDYFFIEAYLKNAKELNGVYYLAAEREAYDIVGEDGKSWPVAKDLAAEVTNYCIAKKWADKASGPYSAKLLMPLEWIAGKFGVMV